MRISDWSSDVCSSDLDPAALASIEAWREEAGLANVRPPIRLDAAADWPVEAADAVLCINLVHISQWAAPAGLFKGCAQLLPAGAPRIIYGPTLNADVQTAPTNSAFQRVLKSSTPAWGRWHVPAHNRVGIDFGPGASRTRDTQ